MMDKRICTNPECPFGEQEATEFAWNSQRGKPHPRCKTCKKAARKEYMERQDPALREKDSARSKAYVEKNKEAVAAYQAEYRAKNREKYKENARRWYAENKERGKENSRRYQQENPERTRELKRAWKHRNPEAVEADRAKRKARSYGVPYENVSREELLERDKGCYLCGELFKSTDQLHMDHIIPLSREELNPTHTIDNLARVHATCNLRKSNMTPEEYWAKNGMI